MPRGTCSSLELTAFGDYTYGAVRATVEQTYVQDDSARTLREVVFNPSLPPALDAATHVFNNWPGLAATRQHPQPLTSADDIAFGMRAINVFVSHVHQVLVGGVAVHAVVTPTGCSTTLRASCSARTNPPR